jgi:Skp family chaperone for outer membrane proteins
MNLAPKLTAVKFNKRFIDIINICVLIAVPATTYSQTSEPKAAYVNKIRIYREYIELQEYHNNYVQKLEDADRDIGNKIRKIDSLYHESVIQSGESSSVVRKYEKDKEHENEVHMDYIRSILVQFDDLTAQCEAKIEKAILEIVEEENFKGWEEVESAEDIVDGVDITDMVLFRVNR